MYMYKVYTVKFIMSNYTHNQSESLLIIYLVAAAAIQYIINLIKNMKLNNNTLTTYFVFK